MAFTPLRRQRLNMPNGDGLDESGQFASAIIDAFLPHQMATRSCRGRTPTSTGPIALSAGKFGVGASAISKSICYDIGKFGESGTFAFLTVAEFLSYGATLSVVRRDGSTIPCQVANNTVRAVGWSSLAASNYYFAQTPPAKKSVLISTRDSQSTERLFVDGNPVLTYSSFSGYGSTTKPLCLLGTETNTELFTSTYGKFYLGVAFNRKLSDMEIRSLSANPWQVFS